MKQLSQQEKLDILGECIDNKIPVVLFYASKDGGKARVIRVDKVDVNQNGLWYFSGDDSLSHEYRSFQLNSVDQMHPLSFGATINITVTFPEDEAQRIPVESDAFQWP